MTQQKLSIPPLTGLRAIAAFMVFFFHFTPPLSEHRSFASAFVLQGHLGVDLFFVLSGFLIAYRYADSAKLELRWLGRYFRNRFARIYPVYLLICLLALIVQKKTDFGSWLIHLTVTVGFAQLKLINLHHAWSITTEECFYFSAPLLFVLTRKRGYLVALLAVAALFVAFSLGFCAIPGLHRFYRLDDWTFIFLRTPFGRPVEFFLGVALGRWFSLHDRDAMRPGKGRITYAALTGFLGTQALMALAELHGLESSGWSTWYGFLRFGLAAAFGALLIFGLIRERTLLSRLLSTPAMVLLGQSSYAFYLFHIGPLPGFFMTQHGMSVLGFFGLLNLFSIAIYKLYESPLNRWIRAEPATRAATVSSVAPRAGMV